MALKDIVNLVSAGWSLDKTNGVFTSYAGPNLTEAGGTVNTTPAKLGNGAVLNGPYLFASDAPSLSFPNGDWTIVVWCKLTSKSAISWLVTKYDGNGEREYYLAYDPALDRYKFVVATTGDGTTIGEVHADAFGSPAVGQWHLIICKHSATNGKISIKVNGLETQNTFVTGSRDGASTFYVGCLRGVEFASCVLDELILIQNHCTTAGEDTELLNNGNGIAFPDWPNSNPPPVAQIVITSPVQYQTLQRDAQGKASIPITGTYAGGSPTAIEASFNGGPFAVIDDSPVAGDFVGTLTNQNADRGTLTVRFANDPIQTATVNLIGIGDVYLVIGDSVGNCPGTSLQNASGPSANFRQVTQSWKSASDPTGTVDNQGSIWPLLATALGNTPTAFITCALGGTDVYGTNNQWVKGGSSYQSMLNTVIASGVNGIKAVLAHLGINSLVSSPTAAQYQAAIEQLATDLAADLPGSPPLYLGLFRQPDNSNQADVDAEYTAIQAAWAVGTVKEGPDFRTIPNDDGIHPQTTAHLQAYADAWAAKLGTGGGSTYTLTVFVGGVQQYQATVAGNVEVYL